MRPKVKFSLGKKLTLLIVLMGVILSLVAILVSYRVFSSTMMGYMFNDLKLRANGPKLAIGN